MSALSNNRLWRLLPGNPIFVRVVEAAAKRTTHALVRIIYLAALVFVVVVGLVVVAFGRGGTLTELSLRSASLFTNISFVQLALACLLAPIFTAGAITQEKDSQTYSVLLVTPLSNAQIVLGSLVSRLYFVLVLLASGIPIFLITQLYGGVPGRTILLSFMIAASTAIFTGAVAVAIAVLRVGTGKTIMAFYIVISLYITTVWFLSGLAWFAAPAGDTSWLTAMHPFLSLQAVLNMSHAPTPADLPGSSWLTRLWLCYPHYAYLCWTLGGSVVMAVLGTIFLRYTHAHTRSDWQRRFRAWLTGGRETRNPRRVWNNPVAWREAVTRASAGGKSLMRWLFMLGGLAVGLMLLIGYGRGALDAEKARYALSATLWIELTVVLLVLCNVSASAITRERESGTLDLLLMTPITSRYYVWGKLRGLISFAAIMLAVPVATALLFAIGSIIKPPSPVSVYPPGSISSVNVSVPLMPLEGVLELGLGMLSFCAFTAMIGLTMSLKVSRTIGAVIWTVAVVGTTALGAAVCGMFALESIPVIGPTIAMSSPYMTVLLATSPHGHAAKTLTDMAPIGFRTMLLVQSVLGALIYAVVVWAMYSSMVRNFDMTIRRQS